MEDALSLVLDALSRYVAGPNRRSSYEVLDKLIREQSGRKSSVSYSRLVLLKVYALALDERVAEAIDLIREERIGLLAEAVKDKEMEGFMARTAFKACNLLEESRSFACGVKDEELFEVNLLQGNPQGSIKYGIRLIGKSVNYYAVPILLGASSAKEDQQILRRILARISNDRAKESFVSVLIRKNICPDVFREYIMERMEECQQGRKMGTFSYFLALKGIITGEYEELKSEILAKVDLDELLEVVDDWGIYEEASKKGLGPTRPKHTLNYKRYLVSAGDEKESEADKTRKILDFVKSGGDFSCIEESLRELSSEAIGTLRISVEPKDLFKLERIFFSKALNDTHCRALAIKPLISSSCSRDFLLGLSVLISSRSETDLLAGLILCYVNRRRFKGHYEAEVLLLVLSRYFLLLDDVLGTFCDLGIKSLQLESLTYLWHDIYLLLGRPKSSTANTLIDAYKESVLGSLSCINMAVIQFVESGAFVQSLSLLELRSSLLNSPIFKQVTAEELQPVDPSRLSIQLILEEDSRFVFKKIVSPAIPRSSSSIFSIDALPSAAPTEAAVRASLSLALEVAAHLLCLPEESVRQIQESFFPSFISQQKILAGTVGGDP